MEAPVQGGQRFFCLSSPVVNLNRSVFKLKVTAGLINPVVELGNELQTGKFESQFSQQYDLSPNGYLKAAALIRTASNLDLIFSLSKNVIMYQQLDQSKYCKKLFTSPSCKKIHSYYYYFYLFMGLFIFSEQC